MTKLLYMDDSYLKEFEASIIDVNGNEIVLDQTAFHPTSGGIVHDTGYLIKNGKKYKVVDVKFSSDKETVIHVLETNEHDLKKGDKIKGEIDWDRRYKLMKLHTATHVLAAVMYNEYNAGITGGNIEPDEAKDDYSLEGTGETKQILLEAIEKTNKILKEGHDVKIYYKTREEAMKIPGIVKLVNRMPPDVNVLRIVEIEGVDIQADGGPHVKNTKEIGELEFIKVKNKGKNRKRVYYKLKE